MMQSMRITTWNVNGLRAALRKGFAEEIERIAPDVLLLQEVRAFPEQLPDGWGEDGTHGWTKHFHPAEKPGYAGVAVWTRGPSAVSVRGVCGPRQTSAPCPEGRVLGVRAGGTEFLSVYLPNGSSTEPARQARKDAWAAGFAGFAGRLARAKRPVVLGGDLNIAHGKNDIHDPRANANSSGFLPHERAWFGSELLGAGWRDEQREAAGDAKGPFSWWSNRGRARELDRGWRIDYLLTNAKARAVAGCKTDRAAGLRCSDHAPVTLTLA